MLNKSKDYNENYTAKIVRLGVPRKHSDADRLLCWNIDFQNVITNLDYKEGDVVVYFPLESAINTSLISYIDGFQDNTQNKNTEVKGYFNKYARVRAVKLRGEHSQGFILPMNVVNKWISLASGLMVAPISDKNIEEEFDSFNDVVICKKYVPKNTHVGLGSGVKQQKSVRISRLVENQFKLHNDTSNLRRNSHMIGPDDIIGIHYKKHGTSWVVGNVLTKKKLSWIERILDKFNISVVKEIYDIIYSSRKVVKNEFETINSQHYYKTDVWADVKDTVKDIIPKGWTLYGEYLGYTKNGTAIQGKYDYGCKQGEGKIYVYRITITNVDGYSIELDDLQIKQFCEGYGLNYSDTFIYYGKAKDVYPDLEIEEHWHENFIGRLEVDYNNKDCYMCINKLPEEGIVVRKQNTFEYEAYKLKSARFLEHETKELDKEIIDIESLEEEI